MLGLETAQVKIGPWLRAHARLGSIGRLPGRVFGRILGRPTLARQFLLANLVMLVVGGGLVGWLIGDVIETTALNRTTSAAALYVASFVEPQVQSLATGSQLTPSETAALQGLLTHTALGEKIVSFRIWSTDGQVLYSPNSELIGRRFDIDAGLAQALSGDLSGHITDLSAPENVYERAHWSRLIEMYVPVRAAASSRIIAVTEFYQLPDELDAEVTRDRLAAWALVAASGLLAYAVLARIVHRGSELIERQESELRERVGELSELLDQNAELHDRVRKAAERSTALGERERRRISADLHDGPGQTLGFALLRLDAIDERLAGNAQGADSDVAAVRVALREALNDLRAVAAGVRMPAIESETPAGVVARAVTDHRRASHDDVEVRLGDLPAEAPVAVKIAMFRVLQEALSNASRHAGAVGLEVRADARNGWLSVEIADRGPGFDPDAPAKEGHLGVAGMRERVELLGGRFEVLARDGGGSIVRVLLPLAGGSAA